MAVIKFQAKSVSKHSSTDENIPKAKKQSEKEECLINKTFPLKIYWTNVVLCVLLHIAALYGLYIALVGEPKWQTYVWYVLLFGFTGIGITGGSHRYYSHGSFKAKLPLRLFLALAQTCSFQYSIYDWSRTHRVHHKYSETNADPHNVTRGFFFAHVGWLLVEEHPAVAQKMRKFNSADLESDEIIMFQKRHYWTLVVICALGIPLIPMYFWGESAVVSFFFVDFFTFSVTLNLTGLINSAAHLWGARPYDKNMSPTDNSFLIYFAAGEGFHNYHHAFPWDYRTDELERLMCNVTGAFIDFMAYIGQAYDLKTVSKDLIKARVARTGDGSHYTQSCSKPGAWGWGDACIAEADKKLTTVLHPSVAS